ncbi:MAG: T9SS type A sorting domain-containing protein, partial [Bacteroidota bacterium]
ISAGSIGSTLPEVVRLYQNYPNPFNPSTFIRFDVIQSGSGPALTEVKIFNVLGEEMATLVSQPLASGSYDVEWNASGFSSGVYFCRLSSDGNIKSKKLILMK